MHYIFLIILLLAVNAAFVLAEMALVSARKARLQAGADKGDKASRTAIALIDHPNRYLSTTQIGITLATILLGVYGETSLAEDLKVWLEHYPALVDYSHHIATALTVVVLTLATLLLAELVPKRLAQMHPEGFARLVARPMDWASRFSSPLVSVLSGVTNLILRLVPLPKRSGQGAEEEVRALLASGAEEGTIHESEQKMVERVFQLGDRRVKALMVPRNDVDYLDADDTTQRVRVVVATGSHSYFPVCEGDLDHLVGVVHVKDLVKHGLILGGSGEINLRLLARKPMFVPESATALKVLDQFRRSGSHFAFVLDEYGVLVGLVTINDLVESVLGEITLPGGPSEPMIVKRADGSYLLDAMLTVGELRLLMEVDHLPKEDIADFDTLGGFVIAYLGRIPATGDRFEFDRFTFEVVDMDRTRVDKVLLAIVPKPRPEGGDENTV